MCYDTGAVAPIGADKRKEGRNGNNEQTDESSRSEDQH